MTTPPALLIAGIGTRDERRTDAFRDFVRELGAHNPGLPVAGGLTGQGRFPLGDAVAGLAEEGVTRFAVVPLTLIPTERAEQDLTAALDRELELRPGSSFVRARPLGPHPRLLTMLERRLDEALGDRPRSPSDRAETTVLLVGSGSVFPEANAEVHRAARLLWEGRGFAGVETAFVSLAAPDVASGLDRCALLGARRVVLLPYFLFAGVSLDRAQQQAEGWSLAHPDIELLTADVPGPAEELAKLVMERYREVAGEQLTEEAAGKAGDEAKGQAGDAAGCPAGVPSQESRRAGSPVDVR
ncbi:MULTISPECIES: sirohydrochlorin chelatase [Streptomyces]|uniref:Sirohydrochlorin chelatase n=1 Tax=Streptomyces lonegramiae TaxID=3075524 RepID=A0ABU2XF55_9ACTN|nr:sirohydrochlorin chelatase [Streptomyces sp. DSM 41529]MDT0544566.1 sirohydrochlorin chelatase [Streptomyces sp. DSM 41529]